MEYSDFYLEEKYGVLRSRDSDECDPSVEFAGFKFRLPVVPSNMDSVIDINLAVSLAEKGYFYILHRFMSYDKLYNFVQNMNTRGLPSSISVGVKDIDRQLVRRMSDGEKPDIICIDIAHGHSQNGKEMVEYIRTYLPDSFLILGNIGSVQGVKDAESWGVDAIKVGLGNGSGCLSTANTGFHCHPSKLSQETVFSVPVIFDGGVRTNGHIAIALSMGADMVMAGGLLAGHIESPKESVIKDGIEYKVYEGSTAQNNRHKEGQSMLVEVKGSIFDTLDEIEQNLRSSISYAGGKDLSTFGNVEIKRY